jgi:hypothetical protein
LAIKARIIGTFFFSLVFPFSRTAFPSRSESEDEAESPTSSGKCEVFSTEPSPLHCDESSQTLTFRRGFVCFRVLFRLLVTTGSSSELLLLSDSDEVAVWSPLSISLARLRTGVFLATDRILMSTDLTGLWPKIICSSISTCCWLCSLSGDLVLLGTLGVVVPVKVELLFNIFIQNFIII